MSEVSLDKLIESIKNDAIVAARAEAERLLSDAREEANTIKRNAESEKNRIIADAKTQSESIIVRGESALRQASRDMQTALRNDILVLLGNALDNQLNANLDGNTMKQGIQQILSNIEGDLELKFSPDMETAITDLLRSDLKNDKNNVVTSRDPSLLKGVILTKTDEGWSYDITADEIGQLLKSYLTDQWIDILTKSSE